MPDSFIVLTPAQAKRLAKTLARARNAIDLVGVQLVAIGVENLVEKLKTKIKKPRKAKAPKAGKNAVKADKPADPLTA
jgi:phenylacetate-coenzyme A ligase PaaK-like adenylate-forming protein